MGLPVVFLIAGIAPLVIGVVAISGRGCRDEIAHPLDAGTESADDAAIAQAPESVTDASEPSRTSEGELVPSGARA